MRLSRTIRQKLRGYRLRSSLGAKWRAYRTLGSRSTPDGPQRSSRFSPLWQKVHVRGLRGGNRYPQKKSLAGTYSTTCESFLVAPRRSLQLHTSGCQYQFSANPARQEARRDTRFPRNLPLSHCENEFALIAVPISRAMRGSARSAEND
jgi:hypothetical protein